MTKSVLDKDLIFRVLKKTVRRLQRALIRVDSHAVFDMAASDSIDFRKGVDCWHVEVVSDANIIQKKEVINLLLDVNRDNLDYVEEIRRGRVVGVFFMNDEGRMVNYSFLFIRNKTACLLGLPKSTGLIGNSFTIPEFRGRGIQGLSVKIRASIAAGHGFDRIAAETSPQNHASQTGMVKGGMAGLGNTEILVILNCIVIRFRRPYGVSLFGFCPR